MGRGKHLTIDEWFYHWFADEEKLPLVSRLFVQILEVCNKIVFQRGNRHADKLYKLFEQSSMYPPKQRQVVKTLGRLFLSNLNKVLYVDAVPDIDESIIPLLPWKDVYVVQVCLASTDKIFITTDTTLYQNLLDTFVDLNITVYMAHDFIARYPDI